MVQRLVHGRIKSCPLSFIWHQLDEWISTFVVSKYNSIMFLTFDYSSMILKWGAVTLKISYWGCHWSGSTRCRYYAHGLEPHTIRKYPGFFPHSNRPLNILVKDIASNIMFVCFIMFFSKNHTADDWLALKCHESIMSFQKEPKILSSVIIFTKLL